MPRGGNNFIDLTGQQFGKWKVLYRGDPPKGSKSLVTFWMCECDCSLKIQRVVRAFDLKRGKSASCGCSLNPRNGTALYHGLSRHKLYKIHDDIERRCNDPNDTGYHNYGGRGIYVCQEWSGIEGRLRFIEWAEANGWEEGLETDRIEVNGPYAPGNCRFITHKENDRNKRDNILFEYNGKMITIGEIIELSGTSHSTSTLYNRLTSMNMSVEEALSTPKLRNNNGRVKFDYNGQMLSAKEIVELTGSDLKPSVLHERLHRAKMGMDEALSKPSRIIKRKTKEVSQ